MGRRRPHKPGRPRLLTPEVEKQLIDAVRAGAPYHVAAAAVGISERTFLLWRSRGADEVYARGEPGYPPNDDEQVFVDFYDKLTQARASAAVRAVVQIQRVAAGGIVTEEVKETMPDGTVRETMRRTPPDWRAAAWYLERQHRADWGKSTALEVTGADGGPVQVEHTVNVETLAARIHERLGELATTPPPLELEATVDAEVIG